MRARRYGWVAQVLALASVSLASISCGSSSIDCTRNGTCTAYETDGGGVPDGGAGDGGPVIVPTDCDLAKPGRESPACLSEGVAIFVSAAGDDSAAGTKAAPVRSIAKGLDLATTKQRPRVYVCAGSYDQAVTVKAPVSILGGVSCDWRYSADAKVLLAPPKGIALRVASVVGAVRIEDLQILGSADPAVPGDSAVAAFVAESTDVTFDHVSLTAGPGVTGAAGATGSNYTASATIGGSASGATGGIGPTCICADGSTSTGGNGAGGSGAGISDGSAKPAITIPNSGSSSASSCTAGTVGAKGASSAALAASTSWGTLTKEGIQLSPIAAVTSNGNPGQGGGGGGAQTNVASAGGGGGCGGCGGAGGAAGGSGGASLGLGAFNATIKINSGFITTGAGGKGGKGGKGQDGQGGGGGGVAAVCQGGPGGPGAGGAGGPGGPGGPSAGIAHVGPAPQTFSTTSTVGDSGLGGEGGDPGAGPGTAGVVGNQGAPGLGKELLPL